MLPPALGCFIIVGYLSDTHALPDQRLILTPVHTSKLTDHFTTYGISCINEHTINFEDIKALKEFQMPKSEDAPCFFACVLKKSGLMDTKGKIPPGAVLSVAKKIFDDEKDFNAVVKVFQACEHVNDLEVTDGAKGCDRAKLALQCLIEQSNMEDTPTNKGGTDTPVENDGETGMPDQKRTARMIITTLVTNVVKLACAGINIVRNVSPLKLITQVLVLPVDTFFSLCQLLA